VFGDRLILKTYERLEPGQELSVEVGRFLQDFTTFRKTAPVVGDVELRLDDAQPVTLAVLYGFIPNESDGWQYTLDQLSRFYESVLTQSEDHHHQHRRKPGCQVPRIHRICKGENT